MHEYPFFYTNSFISEKAMDVLKYASFNTFSTSFYLCLFMVANLFYGGPLFIYAFKCQFVYYPYTFLFLSISTQVGSFMPERAMDVLIYLYTYTPICLYICLYIFPLFTYKFTFVNAYTFIPIYLYLRIHRFLYARKGDGCNHIYILF